MLRQASSPFPSFWKGIQAILTKGPSAFLKLSPLYFNFNNVRRIAAKPSWFWIATEAEISCFQTFNQSVAVKASDVGWDNMFFLAFQWTVVWRFDITCASFCNDNYSHVTTQIILNKFIEVNFSVGYMVWPWCCLFQPLTTSKTINKTH